MRLIQHGFDQLRRKYQEQILWVHIHAEGMRARMQRRCVAGGICELECFESGYAELRCKIAYMLHQIGLIERLQHTVPSHFAEQVLSKHHNVLRAVPQPAQVWISKIKRNEEYRYSKNNKMIEKLTKAKYTNIRTDKDSTRR